MNRDGCHSMEGFAKLKPEELAELVRQDDAADPETTPPPLIDWRLAFRTCLLKATNPALADVPEQDIYDRLKQDSDDDERRHKGGK